jgi:hypothetical protein
MSKLTYIILSRCLRKTDSRSTEACEILFYDPDFKDIVLG